MKRLAGRSSHLYDRDGKFYFRRAVPTELRSEIGKSEWKYSVGCMSYMRKWEAERAAEQLFKKTETDIAIARRRIHHLDKPSEWNELGLHTHLQDDLLERAAKIHGGVHRLGEKFPDISAVARTHGIAAERAFFLCERPLSDVYRYVRETHPVKSEKHRLRAVEEFIEVMGDRDVMTILRRDVMQFVNEYKKGQLAPSTQHRRLGALTTIINQYFRDHDIQKTNPFEGSVKEIGGGHTADAKRPLSDEQVQTLISFLRGSNEMDPAIRAAFWLIITTGVGPAEARCLVDADIVLDDSIPHVWIRANEIRELKAESRYRRLPLIGPALTWAPHLTSRPVKPQSAGAAMNKQLNKAVALGERQSLYSLRHWMADRLRSVGASEHEARYVLGHSTSTPHERYGSRHLSLDRLKRLLESASV